MLYLGQKLSLNALQKDITEKDVMKKNLNTSSKKIISVQIFTEVLILFIITQGLFLFCFVFVGVLCFEF